MTLTGEPWLDLVAFFEHIPNLVRDERSRFSFFNGLGATSKLSTAVIKILSQFGNLHCYSPLANTPMRRCDILECVHRTLRTSPGRGGDEDFMARRPHFQRKRGRLGRDYNLF